MHLPFVDIMDEDENIRDVAPDSTPEQMASVTKYFEIGEAEENVYHHYRYTCMTCVMLYASCYIVHATCYRAGRFVHAEVWLNLKIRRESLSKFCTALFEEYERQVRAQH
jgi:hypothetical protein